VVRSSSLSRRPGDRLRLVYLLPMHWMVSRPGRVTPLADRVGERTRPRRARTAWGLPRTETVRGSPWIMRLGAVLAPQKLLRI
jgi:hypothetical protein